MDKVCKQMKDAYLSLGNENIASWGIFCFVPMVSLKIKRNVVLSKTWFTQLRTKILADPKKNIKGPAAAVINAAAHVGGGGEEASAHDTLRE